MRASSTVKPVQERHPRDHQKVALLDRWRSYADNEFSDPEVRYTCTVYISVYVLHTSRPYMHPAQCDCVLVQLHFILERESVVFVDFFIVIDKRENLQIDTDASPN